MLTHRNALTRLLPAATLALTTTACPGGSGDDPTNERNQTVLVIDDGFDTSIPELAGKVVASYTLTCTNVDDLPTDGATDLAGKKAALLAHLQQPDDRCRLEPGIANAPDPLPGVAKYRKRWNDALLAHQTPSLSTAERSELIAAFQQNLTDDMKFHGTAVAGIVAHANPHVKLVLVQRELGTEAAAEQGFTCPDAQAFADEVALLEDPDVRRALVQRPRGTADTQIASIIAEHGIGLANESYGQPATAFVQRLLMMKQCPSIDVRAEARAEGELVAMEATAHPDDVLRVVAAGNEGARTDEPADQIGCMLGNARFLRVGSYGHDRAVSTFSNYGECVDAFAPGEDILAPIPGNWWIPLAGTSFSAPLTVRALSQARIEPFSPEAARTLALGWRDADRKLPTSRFPADLLYTPPASQLALTLASPSPSGWSEARRALAAVQAVLGR